MTAEQRYTEQLKSLAAEGVKFRCIGTYALKLMLGEFLESYVLKDADIVLEPSEANIRHCIIALRQRGWIVTVWQEEVNESVEIEFLKGKFYLRARQGDLTLDATYECPIPYAEMHNQGNDHFGVPLAHPSHILELKERKGNPEDRDLIDAIGQALASK